MYLHYYSYIYFDHRLLHISSLHFRSPSCCRRILNSSCCLYCFAICILILQLMEVSVIGLPGTRVLSRVVVEHRVERGIAPTRHLHMLEQTALGTYRRHKLVIKCLVQVIRINLYIRVNVHVFNLYFFSSLLKGINVCFISFTGYQIGITCKLFECSHMTFNHFYELDLFYQI